MPNYLDYRKSISNELMSTKDRVRNFIDSNHWGEDGRYKEIILIETLRKMIPSSVSVGTGFVMCDDNKVSSQIDIIIYKNSHPVLFKIADFIIVPKESVVGIIEVKSNLDASKIKETISKSHKNGQIIGKNIFNGIFGYEASLTKNAENPLPDPAGTDVILNQNVGYINHICFGKDFFMKYWNPEIVSTRNTVGRFSFYKIENLAFGYFISNLIEIICEVTNAEIGQVTKSFLYPIKETKEVNVIHYLDVGEVSTNDK